jgi:hypothetical protein
VISFTGRSLSLADIYKALAVFDDFPRLKASARRGSGPGPWKLLPFRAGTGPKVDFYIGGRGRRCLGSAFYALSVSPDAAPFAHDLVLSSDRRSYPQIVE